VMGECDLEAIGVPSIFRGYRCAINITVNP
jgi:hypothetical protein